MGDEHDSWLQSLGVNFEPPDAGAWVSKVKEGVDSARNAEQDLQSARVEMEAAARMEIVGKKQYVEAGFLDAQGFHESAQEVRNRAEANENDASAQFESGLKDAGKAKDEVVEGEEDSHTKADAKFEDSKKAKQRRTPKVGLGVKPMLPDCKIVRGKVPGPANHVLCCTHGHIVDLGTKTIIAANLEHYKQLYGKGGLMAE
ncbi:MAG TPA: hypothetical protein VMZ27_13755 [Candidatus Saccharimonadales bacterium]|nr:hypothetical protein [Candidatus Saccharimonadales bacterium]